MLKKRDPGGAGKKNLNVTAARRSSYSVGTVSVAFRFAPSVLRNVAFRFAPSVLRKTSGA
jgi:hypothetical protein